MYQIIGASVLLIFIIHYIVKMFCTVPQTKHKSGLLPHILALKVCCLIVYPAFFAYISFCKGFMSVDLPWANKLIAEKLVSLNDVVMTPFSMFFNNLSIAGTFLVGLAAYITLKILGFFIFSESEKPKSKDSINSQ